MGNKLVICVKQSENIVKQITIKAGDSPIDLNAYDNVTVDVKKAPYKQYEPIIHKVITTSSDADTVGQITDPTNGILQVRFTQEDTSFPPNDYYLIIYLNGNGSSDIISSECCCNAIYRVCTQ